MERISSQEEVRQALAPSRREGKTIALVPTMGALHAGHLSLVHAARARADVVVVSIFVNPLQFGEGEDFTGYPRPIEHDLSLLKAEGVDMIFIPSAEAMYRAGTDMRVHPGPLGDVWEGATRPGHFAGVTTIVTKLLNIVRPSLAFFGEKDYQQLVVIKRMVSQFDVPTTVVGCPTVRERDGLALSSRNAYLSAVERRAAPVLHRALDQAQELVANGERDVTALEIAMREVVGAEPLAQLDYAAVVDPSTLTQPLLLDGRARAIIAATIGTTRLIDNVALEA